MEITAHLTEGASANYKRLAEAKRLYNILLFNLFIHNVFCFNAQSSMRHGT